MTFALFAIAFLGHFVLMTRSHNWFYGQNYSKRTGDIVHLVHALLVLALPVGCLRFWGWQLDGLFDLREIATPGGPVIVYLWLCVFVGAGWFPALTVYRLYRREPVSNVRSEVVDIAKQLGSPPVGEGHHAFFTRSTGP